MLRFDIAFQALKRRMASSPKKAKPAEDAKPSGVLIPFPLRRLATEADVRQKRRAPG